MIVHDNIATALLVVYHKVGLLGLNSRWWNIFCRMNRYEKEVSKKETWTMPIYNRYNKGISGIRYILRWNPNAGFGGWGSTSVPLNRNCRENWSFFLIANSIPSGVSCRWCIYTSNIQIIMGYTLQIYSALQWFTFIMNY